MSEEVTKTQLNALLEVYATSAGHLEKIAHALAEIVKCQDTCMGHFNKIEERLTNGITEVIVKKVDEKIQVAVTPLALTQKNIAANAKAAADNSNWLKIILGGATLIILIVTVVVNTMTSSRGLTQGDMTILLKEIHKEVAESHER